MKIPLAERYCPRRIADFIGIERAKATMNGLIADPGPCSFLFIGPPGAGKTALGMALAEQMPASLVHIGAQRCDVAELERLRDRMAYTPPTGQFWIVLVDEADQMTEKAQLHLLSKLDQTASLVPVFGGGYQRGTPPPVIFIFTCNGIGPNQTDAPFSLLPRFQSRNEKIEFPAATKAELAAYLERIWKLEGGAETPEGYFEYMAEGDGIRDALMRLDTDLKAGPRTVPALNQPEVEIAEKCTTRIFRPKYSGKTVVFKPRAWSAEEDAIIRKLNRDQMASVAMKMNRSTQSLYTRLRRLNAA